MLNKKNCLEGAAAASSMTSKEVLPNFAHAINSFYIVTRKSAIKMNVVSPTVDISTVTVLLMI